MPFLRWKPNLYEAKNNRMQRGKQTEGYWTNVIFPEKLCKQKCILKLRQSVCRRIYFLPLRPRPLPLVGVFFFWGDISTFSFSASSIISSAWSASCKKKVCKKKNFCKNYLHYYYCNITIFREGWKRANLKLLPYSAEWGGQSYLLGMCRSL